MTPTRVNAQVDENPPETYTFTPAQALQPNTIYYWRVVSRTYATDAKPSLAARSGFWSFRTAAGPGGGSGPFLGTPVSLPGNVEAENFDNGAAGVAYVDTTAGNTGGQYRTTDVDVTAAQDAGGGYLVGWVNGGEWVNYTVNVTAAGTYDMEFRVASDGTGGTFHVDSRRRQQVRFDRDPEYRRLADVDDGAQDGHALSAGTQIDPARHGRRRAERRRRQLQLVPRRHSGKCPAGVDAVQWHADGAAWHRRGRELRQRRRWRRVRRYVAR